VLVQEAAAGSGVSYGALYDRYAPQVFNYCLRLTGSPDDASDATQEAFVNVLRRLQDDDRPVLEFSSYLFAAARHESYALMRHRTRTHPSDSPPVERARVADVETDPERAILLRDSQEAVREANAQLAPRHREVLALREVAGRSYDEIGETMGISENAAAQLIWRARAKLREAMTAGAVASVVATSEECETAQLLLSRVQDGELVDEVDRLWLDEHLEDCGSCRTANRILLEVGASYRCWLPVALLAGMRSDTLARAGALVGADWSHVAAPGKAAAGASGSGAGPVAAGTALVAAAAAVGALVLLPGDEAARVAPDAKQPAPSAPAAADQTAPARDSAVKRPPRLVAARAPLSGAAPAAAPAESRIPVNGPETRGAPPEGDAPQDRPPQPEDRSTQPPGDGPRAGPPAAPEPPSQTPTQPEPRVRTPAPSMDPPPPPPRDPECGWPGRGKGPGECPAGHGAAAPGHAGEAPGHGGVPPGHGGTPPGHQL